MNIREELRQRLSNAVAEDRVDTRGRPIPGNRFERLQCAVLLYPEAPLDDISFDRRNDLARLMKFSPASEHYTVWYPQWIALTLLLPPMFSFFATKYWLQNEHARVVYWIDHGERISWSPVEIAILITHVLVNIVLIIGTYGVYLIYLFALMAALQPKLGAKLQQEVAAQEHPPATTNRGGQ